MVRRTSDEMKAHRKYPVLSSCRGHPCPLSLMARSAQLRVAPIAALLGLPTHSRSQCDSRHDNLTRPARDHTNVFKRRLRRLVLTSFVNHGHSVPGALQVNKSTFTRSRHSFVVMPITHSFVSHWRDSRMISIEINSPLVRTMMKNLVLHNLRSGHPALLYSSPALRPSDHGPTS